MLTLVWSCIGCARYGGHRVGWGGACWRWFEVASDVHATVDIGLGGVGHVDVGLKLNLKKYVPKELSTHEGLGHKRCCTAWAVCANLSVSLESENESGRCIGQKSCKASRISVRKHDPAEKREAWIAIALQIEHDAHAPMQKMVQNACVPIWKKTYKTWDIGDKHVWMWWWKGPGSLSAAIPYFSLGYTMLVSWTMGDKHGNKRIYIDKQYMFNWRCYLLIFKNVRGYFTCYLLSLITTVSAWWLAKYPNGELTGALATNPVLHACTLQNSTHCK